MQLWILHQLFHILRHQHLVSSLFLPPLFNDFGQCCGLQVGGHWCTWASFSKCYMNGLLMAMIFCSCISTEAISIIDIDQYTTIGLCYRTHHMVPVASNCLRNVSTVHDINKISCMSFRRLSDYHNTMLCCCCQISFLVHLVLFLWLLQSNMLSLQSLQAMVHLG